MTKLTLSTPADMDKMQIYLGNAKLDIMRTEDGQVVVGEVKKRHALLKAPVNSCYSIYYS